MPVTHVEQTTLVGFYSRELHRHIRAPSSALYTKTFQRGPDSKSRHAVCGRLLWRLFRFWPGPAVRRRAALCQLSEQNPTFDAKANTGHWRPSPRASCSSGPLVSDPYLGDYCARCRLRADARARRMYRSSAPPRHDRRPTAFMIWSQIQNDPGCMDPIRTSRSSDRVPESGRAGPSRYLEARALQESRKPVPSPGLRLFAPSRLTRTPIEAAFHCSFARPSKNCLSGFLAQNLGDGFPPKTITVNPDPERARPPLDFPHPNGRVSEAPGDHVVVA
jgi:hypothetical protein